MLPPKTAKSCLYWQLTHIDLQGRGFPRMQPRHT